MIRLGVRSALEGKTCGMSSDITAIKLHLGEYGFHAKVLHLPESNQ